MQILYYIHTSKAKSNGLAPLKLRVTVGPNDRTEWSTGKFVDPKLWDVKSKRVTGKSVNADILNKFIVTQESKLMKIEGDLQGNDTPYTAEIIRNIYQGKHVARYGLLQVLDIHNDLFTAKLGQEGFSPDTLKKYTGLKNKLEYFIKIKYKRSEIFVTELNHDFIESFWHFLVTKGKLVKGEYAAPTDPETACGIIKRLKKVSRMGFRKQGISVNPFEEFKETFTKSSKVPLTMDEINQIINTDMKNDSLNRVKDRLIIGVFTGMANSDIQSATADMVINDITGQKYIQRDRTKTGELCIIPLWEPVLKIIERYENDPHARSNGKQYLFPQISLQKMNSYLKIVAAAAGVDRHLSTHLLRHSFADIYLNAGGTLENLARILGHSSTRTTSGYAKRNKTTIVNEANMVKENIFGQIRDINQRKTS